MLAKMYAERRWRLAAKSLPLDFQKSGVFEYQAKSSKSFCLTLRTGTNSLISMCFDFPLASQEADATQVIVEENWSEGGAYLQNQQGTLEGLMCLDLLKSRMRDGQLREEQSAAAPRALCDSAPSSMRALQWPGDQEAAAPTWMQVATHFGKRSLQSVDGSSDAFSRRGSGSAGSASSPPSSSKYSRKSSSECNEPVPDVPCEGAADEKADNSFEHPKGAEAAMNDVDEANAEPASPE